MIVVERPNGLRLFFALRGSILPRIVRSLLTCTLLAVAVSFSHGVLFDWKVTLTPVPFSLIGLALAIFLGFRNGAAYERYVEGRRLWGDITHRSRSLARQWQSLLGAAAPARDADRGDPRVQFLRRTVAFAHALRHQLRHTDPSADLRRLLGAGEAHAAAASRVPHDWLLRRNGLALGERLQAGAVEAPLAAEIDRHLSDLAAAAAGCERIQATPIPFAYTLLLHRTAYLYCFLLPFGLVDLIGPLTPFVVAIVAYTFFGLDAVGDEIADPFGVMPHHLPLEAICTTIEISLLEALDAAELPPTPRPVDGLLL